MVYTGKKCVRFLSLLLALMMVFTVCGTGVLAESTEGSTDEGSAAETTLSVPDPSANFYIHDEENILSNETKTAILTKNASLYEKYGIQIIVLTMQAIPGADVNAKGAYLHQIIDSWQVGGTSEKCLVLMLSVTEQNYVAVAGDGLSAEFPVDTWSTLFNQYLEPDFAAQQYDAGVLKFFNAIADKAEQYAVNSSMTAAGTAATVAPVPSAEPEENKDDEEKPSIFGTILHVIGTIIFIVLVILIIGFIVIYVHGQMVRKKRREARRRKAMQARAQQNDRRPPTQNNNDYNNFMNRY